MIEQVNQFKRELLLSTNAITYLKDRGVDSSVAEKFNIGFCPPTSNYSFDLLNGRLVIPIYDVYNNYIAFTGRKLENYNKEVKNFYQHKSSKLEGLEKFLKWKSSKWINTPYKKSNHLYNLNNAKKSIFEFKFCIIVEGCFDVIHLNNLGYPNVIALCGTSLTEKQCELLFRYCNKIVFILDGDPAGKTATIKGVRRARSKNIFSNIVELPLGVDPDNLNNEIMDNILNEIINSEEELYIKL